MYNKIYRQQAITKTVCSNYELDVFGMVTG